MTVDVTLIFLLPVKALLIASLCCLLSVLCANGQTVQGTIKDGISRKPLFPVTVVNTRTLQVVYSDAHGNYVIAAENGDEITYSCIGYRKEQRIKPKSVLIATVNVDMEPVEYQLQEVRLQPGLLTRYQRDSIERKVTYKSVLERRPPSPVMSPVSAIADKFSKKSQRAYQFQKDFANSELQKFIDTRYTPALVSSVNNISGDTVAWFMYYHPMPYDFARAATNLELKMWVRDNFKKWHVKNPLADTSDSN